MEWQVILVLVLAVIIILFPAMNMSIKKAAQGLIQKGKVISEGLLNMVEMAFRAYDPCMACATHTLPGQMPLEVVIYDSSGKTVEILSQHFHLRPAGMKVTVV